MYRYMSNSLLIKEDFSRYEETVEKLLNGLEEQVPPQDVSQEELLDDEDLEIPESVFEGEVTVEPLQRYRIDDSGEKRTVYTFDRSLGLEVVGDYAMIRQAVPEYIPDSVIPMQEIDETV